MTDQVACADSQVFIAVLHIHTISSGSRASIITSVGSHTDRDFRPRRKCRCFCYCFIAFDIYHRYRYRLSVDLQLIQFPSNLMRRPTPKVPGEAVVLGRKGLSAQIWSNVSKCLFIIIIINDHSCIRIHGLRPFRCIKGKLIDLLILQCHHIIACNIIK